MKVTAIIEGKHGRVEMTADSGTTYKYMDGCMSYLKDFCKQVKDAYDHLKEQSGEGQ